MTIRLGISAQALELYPDHRMRFSRQVAEELVWRYGAFAHMHALEALESRDQEHSRALWRDVLTTLDELKNDEKFQERIQDDTTELRTPEAD